jgi:GNAT superfamily N-acetyltransferase
VDLLLSQPEILRWLELNEEEVVAWLAPNDSDPVSGRVQVVETAISAPTRRLEPAGGPVVVAKPLRHGDVRTVMGIFAGLGERSRRFRFNGPKPCLTRSELRQLATVDERRQALVACVEDDLRPIGIARLVRSGSSAEIAFAVVDVYQRRGIGSALVSELVADARTAGITELTALVSAGNTAALALLRRVANGLAVRHEGTELAVRAAIA